jgi:hypothetical protein
VRPVSAAAGTSRPPTTTVVVVVVAAVVIISIGVILPDARSQRLLEYLRVLSWPIVVLVVALTFRARFEGLLGRLKSAEVPGGKFEFTEERLTQIERVAEGTLEAASDVRRAVDAMRPPQESSARDELVGKLRQLRDDAGSPSYPQIARRSGWGDGTVHDVMTGGALPRWSELQDFVMALDPDADLVRWREAWRRASDGAASD